MFAVTSGQANLNSRICRHVGFVSNSSTASFLCALCHDILSVEEECTDEIFMRHCNYCGSELCETCLQAHESSIKKVLAAQLHHSIVANVSSVIPRDITDIIVQFFCGGCWVCRACPKNHRKDTLVNMRVPQCCPQCGRQQDGKKPRGYGQGKAPKKEWTCKHCNKLIAYQIAERCPKCKRACPGFVSTKKARLFSHEICPLCNNLAASAEQKVAALQDKFNLTAEQIMEYVREHKKKEEKKDTNKKALEDDLESDSEREEDSGFCKQHKRPQSFFEGNTEGLISEEVPARP